jgi:hypothetical protein
MGIDDLYHKLQVCAGQCTVTKSVFFGVDFAFWMQTFFESTQSFSLADGFIVFRQFFERHTWHC